MSELRAALRLSVLDQSPVPAGHTPSEALANSLDLARHVDRLGYTRLWYSEHHAMAMLACTAPEILIARAAAATKTIRVGSGGVMLPHYSAFKVAEVFRTLHAMFPGRIDLGIGRAPGGGQLESYALRRNRQTPPADDFPQQLAELLAYLHPERFAEFARQNGSEHPFRNVLVSPDAPGAPDVWLLGSSMWSAVTAAQEGLPYAYAHFFSAGGTRQAIEYYQQNFQPSRFAQPSRTGSDLSSRSSSNLSSRSAAEGSAFPVPNPALPSGGGRRIPEATLAIGVICAPTQEEADHLHASVRLLQRRIRTGDRRPVATPEDALRELGAERPEAPNPFLSFTAGDRSQFSDEPDEEYPRYVVGTPDRVAVRLYDLAADLHLGELIVNTITHSHEARLRSYTLLAETMGLNTAAPALEMAKASA